MTCVLPVLLTLIVAPAEGAVPLDRQAIMQRLTLDSRGRTEVVKDFPDTFPEVLTARGEPRVYTRANSRDFEYLGMPVGGIGAGQLYLGGDGKLWFWDIFNLNYHIGQLKGEEAYQHPYTRSRPNERGARAIEQGFSLRVTAGDRVVTRTLDRDGIQHIRFLGQYPIGEVTYRDPNLPVTVTLEAFSPFIPLDLDDSMYPATILHYTLRNTAAIPVTAELTGWLENAVLCGSRDEAGVRATLCNTVVSLPHGGRRLLCTARPRPVAQGPLRPDQRFEDFEDGFVGWRVEGEAFAGDGRPNYHQQPLRRMQGHRLADSMAGNRAERTSDRATGRLVSPTVRIERDFLRCRVGGGRHPGRTCLNLRVGEQVVASITGDNSETLRSAVLDLRPFQGREGVVEIVDAETGSWGHILVDDLVFTDRPAEPVTLPARLDWGTMSLAVLGEGTFATPEGRQEQAVSRATPLIGRLGRRVDLPPGASTEVTFLLTWHFPNTRVLRNPPERRYYARRFRDAAAVSDVLLADLERLTATTRLWRDTWYDATLPNWFLERTFLNTSILASSTTHLLRDRLLYGFEGGYQGPGTCTHVWGYVQAMGHLFPELEKSLREQVDFRPEAEGGALLEDGIIRYRWSTGAGLAVDGQSGCILRAYLCHQMSPDDRFLRGIYPNLKRAMQGLTAARDADHDGILTGPQHNTLDAAWYGKVTWLSLYYQAALRAAAEMADDLNDRDFARTCREIADRGRHYVEQHLFNGEYFFHEADPNHPESPGVYTGCEYSQLLGQSWAYAVGLGPILDSAQVTTALDSLWRYNFTTDVGPFRAVHRPGRWYAMPGEGGLIACTWPRGGAEVLAQGNPRFAAYNNECQNGYEYATTSLMMWHDMPYRSLAHIWYLQNDRYDGAKRNPWCEVEWGIHYSRSMASYGHFTAACGFELHGPRGHLGFAPRITPEHFRAAFTAPAGWGRFAQERRDGVQTETLTVRCGHLDVANLAFVVADGHRVRAVTVTRAGAPLACTFRQAGRRIEITLAQRHAVHVGADLTITLQ